MQSEKVCKKSDTSEKTEHVQSENKDDPVCSVHEIRVKHLNVTVHVMRGTITN